jgi:hypothetical protein
MTARMPKKRACAALAVYAAAQWLAGCHGSDYAGPPPAPVATPRPATQLPPAPAWHGFFGGWVWINGEQYDGDALLTADGTMRLLIHGPYVPFGSGLRLSDNASTLQFIGSFTVAGNAAAGSGVILGPACAAANTHEFCGVALPADLALDTGTRQKLGVEIVLGQSRFGESWAFAMSWMENLYTVPASIERIAGSYYERFSDFAAETDVVVTIDDNGQIFFQSADTGCVGNGSLVPHSDGAFNVFDVAMQIENCAAQFGHLAGQFDGLATVTQAYSGFYCASYYDRCEGLGFWLSSSAGTSAAKSLALRLVPN